MSDLPVEIVRRIEQEMDARIAAHRGVIESVNASAGSAAVTIAAGTVTALSWLGSYSPVVGDKVLILRVGTEWVILGKLSRVTSSAAGRTTVIATPASVYTGHAVAATPNLITWVDAATYGIGAAYQGMRVDTSPARTWGSVGVFAGLSALIPSGATVIAARVAMTRVNVGAGVSGASLVSPVLVPHAYTAKPADGYALAVVGGYGELRPGSLTIGQSASWDLPSWLTGILSGAIKGVGMYSVEAADFAAFASLSSLVLEITYTT